jgi:hypothetical protein
MKKSALMIDRLDTIEEILDTLPILNYSTQKRNLAHLIQLKQLLEQIFEHYEINRGLAIIYKYNLLKCKTDIIETLLYCVLKDRGFIVPKGKGKATKLIQIAKKFTVISKETANGALRMVDYRNDIHPDEQTELHAKVTREVFQDAESILSRMFGELKKYKVKEQYEQNFNDVHCSMHNM